MERFSGLILKRNILRIISWGVLVIPIFFISPKLHGQTSPKYSNEFLAIGVGARGLGMSNAMTSTVNDVTAAYWNPAALTDIEYRYQFSFQHAAYFQGIANYDYLGFAYAVDKDSHLAVSLIRLGIDDIPDTRFLFDPFGNLDYDGVQFFNASDIALIFSYARGVSFVSGEPFATGLTFGANFKVIRRNVGDFADAWGFGVDISAKYRYHGWDFGLMIRDVTTTFNAWSVDQSLIRETFTLTGNEIPANSLELTLPRMLLGASRSFSITDKIDVLAAADLVFTFDGRRNVLVKTGLASLDPQFGFEFDYEDKFFLRMGIGNFQRVKEFSRDLPGQEATFWTFQPNMGIGVQLEDFTIDYALTDIGNVAESPYSHVFSIRYNLEALPGLYSANKRKLKEVKDEN